MEGPIGGYAGATPRASRSAEREKPEKEKQNLPLLSLFSKHRENRIHAKTNTPEKSSPSSRRPAEPVARRSVRAARSVFVRNIGKSTRFCLVGVNVLEQFRNGPDILLVAFVKLRSFATIGWTSKISVLQFAKLICKMEHGYGNHRLCEGFDAGSGPFRPA
jgi:hypothetical protein